MSVLLYFYREGKRMQRVREQVQVPEQIYSVTWRSEPVTVAVLDTGIAYHPDLAGHLLCFRDFVEKSSLPYDDNGHGTHVCGILCGNGELSGGRLRGMAPASKLVVGKVLDGKGEGSCDSMQEAFQWILRVKNRYQIRILNISVGIGELKERYKEQVLREYMELLWDHNILGIVGAATVMTVPWGSFATSADAASRNLFCMAAGIVAAILLDFMNEKLACFPENETE
jgi:serine protease AprX